MSIYINWFINNISVTSDTIIPTFLKWAGGKRRLISQLSPYFPKSINNYYEPFLGGGFIFFYIKRLYNPKKCLISDINPFLVNAYIQVRDNPEEVIRELKKLKKNNSKKFYYQMRLKFNQNRIGKIKRAAIFIYLNKTCYNGLYRVNMRGEFNVPYGEYKDPEIFNKDVILEASKLLQNTVIKCQDYRKVLSNLRKNDFLYLDPCYDPLTRQSFAHYTPERFTIEDRLELRKFISAAKIKGTNIVLSNNDIKVVRELYSDMNVSEISAGRCINSNSRLRGKITELVIYN